MEPESSLPSSQAPVTCPYPEPTPSSPHNPVFVGPCQHGMARPQVADRGTACDMEGSCE